MSKPVTHEEVEDVLSSIRRLVSEDKRPMAGLRNVAVEPVAEADPEPEETPSKAADVQSDNRFVLTPSLRVAEPVEATETAQPDNSEDEPPLDLASVARETWEDSDEGVDDDIDEVSGEEKKSGPMILRAAPFSVAEDNNPSDDTAMEALDALVHETLEESAAQGDEDETDEGDYSDPGYWDVEEPEVSHDAHDSDNDSAQDEEGKWPLSGDESLADYDEVHAPMPPETDDAEEYENVEQPDAEHDDEAHHDTQEAATAEPSDKNDDEAEPARTASIALTAKIAALEAAVGKIGQQWEPDGDEDSLATASKDAPTMAWEDDVELDANGAPVSDQMVDEVIDEVVEDVVEDVRESVASVDTSEQTGGVSNDDQLMDEESLRDLVTEIVRAELQGALGERITRNVRKLVRREIHRALTAQEME